MFRHEKSLKCKYRDLCVWAPNIGLLPFMSATVIYGQKMKRKKNIWNLKFIVLNGFWKSHRLINLNDLTDETLKLIKNVISLDRWQHKHNRFATCIRYTRYPFTSQYASCAHKSNQMNYSQLTTIKKKANEEKEEKKKLRIIHVCELELKRRKTN